MSASPPADPTWLDLHDWRERVASMYRDRDARLRAGEPPTSALQRFRAAKDDLLARHPQSPLDPNARSSFAGLRYFDYDPTLRLAATLTLDEASDPVPAPSSGPHAMPLRRAARLDFTIAGIPQTLPVYWIDVYGGGLFLPFRDATCPDESYGAGRYLFDTVKGSTFERVPPIPASDAPTPGYSGGPVILDFNYAYNPSCAYDVRWVCPLAPRANWLSVPIRAGERDYHAPHDAHS